MVEIKRFDVCLIQLDPVMGSELQKSRPCLIISPDSMNFSRLNTIIIAPMTTVIREHFPTRIDIEFQNKQGQVALDQLRAIDRVRIVKQLGTISSLKTKRKILEVLQVLFT